MKKFKDIANNSFFQRDYKRALLNYSLALKEEPEDEEARIGALLADMAQEREEEAMALFEYYEVSKMMDKAEANEILEQIIASVDSSVEMISDFVNTIESRIVAIEDGILYDDFIAHVSSRGDEKRAIEDLMFSTKIIIYKQEDFIELIEMMIRNEFVELAYKYLESALLMYPHNENLYKLLKLLESK